MGVTIDILQTVAILAALGFSIWQWKKTREMIKVDNYAKIIAALNDLRDYRLAHPEVEKALFESRRGWTDDEIRKRVYGVMFANIFEWTYFSHKEHLIDDKQWKSWEAIWKEVILADASFAELMSDRTIYTFSFAAHDLVKKWVDEIKGKKE